MIRRKKFADMIAATLALALTSTLGGSAALAQATYFPGDVGRAREQRAGHGEFSLTYQHSHFNGYKESFRTDPHAGIIDAHALYAQIDFFVTDRLSLQAGLPVFVARYRGDFPHRHPGHEELDNGTYHGGPQDFIFGARYLALDEQFKIEPFVLMTVPSHGYTFHAESSIGQHLVKGEIGSTFTYVPPFDDWFVTASGSYVFTSRPLGHNINHAKATLDVGYYLTTRFAVRALVLAKQGNGLSWPRDFPPDDHELDDLHDKLLKNNYVNAGVGFDWFFKGGRRISGAAIRMIQSEDVHILKYGLMLTIGQSF